LSLDGKALKACAGQLGKIRINCGFILHEGKKRQIRRMCELVNLKITGLKRVRIGKVKLGNLPEGQWRYLEDGEQLLTAQGRSKETGEVVRCISVCTLSSKSLRINCCTITKAKWTSVAAKTTDGRIIRFPANILRSVVR
jgi:hypothetical protein